MKTLSIVLVIILYILTSINWYLMGESKGIDEVSKIYENKRLQSKKLSPNQLFFNTEVIYADSNIIVLKPIK